MMDVWLKQHPGEPSFPDVDVTQPPEALHVRPEELHPAPDKIRALCSREFFETHSYAYDGGILYQNANEDSREIEDYEEHVPVEHSEDAVYDAVQGDSGNLAPRENPYETPVYELYDVPSLDQSPFRRDSVSRTPAHRRSPLSIQPYASADPSTPLYVAASRNPQSGTIGSRDDGGYQNTNGNKPIPPPRKLLPRSRSPYDLPYQKSPVTLPGIPCGRYDVPRGSLAAVSEDQNYTNTRTESGRRRFLGAKRVRRNSIEDLHSGHAGVAAAAGQEEVKGDGGGEAHRSVWASGNGYQVPRVDSAHRERQTAFENQAYYQEDVIYFADGPLTGEVLDKAEHSPQGNPTECIDPEDRHSGIRASALTDTPPKDSLPEAILPTHSSSWKRLPKTPGNTLLMVTSL